MEDNLPKIVREMITFYVDQKFEKRFDLFLTKEEFKKDISYKMDYQTFLDHCKVEQDEKNSDNSQFRVNERFAQLEKQIKGLVSST